jgi:nucleolar MIF4G domain-containing protein 1
VKKLKSSSKKQVAAEERALSEDETCGPVVRKVKKSSKTSSKKKKVEMGVSEMSFAAQKDLELERKLSKRLKVKEGKLGGLDDGLNMLFEGLPSGDDLFDTDELPKRKSKKSSSNKKQKLSKKGVEAESLYAASGPLEASNQDVAFEEVPDSEISRKKNKKRKLVNHEQEDGVGDGDVCIVKPVESFGTDATSGDVAAEVSEKKEKGKYIAPHLRARAGNEPEEHTQIRRRVRGRKGRDFVLISYF